MVFAICMHDRYVLVDARHGLRCKAGIVDRLQQVSWPAHGSVKVNRSHTGQHVDRRRLDALDVHERLLHRSGAGRARHACHAQLYAIGAMRRFRRAQGGRLEATVLHGVDQGVLREHVVLSNNMVKRQCVCGEMHHVMHVCVCMRMHAAWQHKCPHTTAHTAGSNSTAALCMGSDTVAEDTPHTLLSAVSTALVQAAQCMPCTDSSMTCRWDAC